MSLNLYWRRPPTPLEPDGCARHPTKGIVARLLWDSDGSLRGEAVLMKGSPECHYLRGVVDTTTHDDVRNELAALLKIVDEYGAAEVWTDD